MKYILNSAVVASPGDYRYTLLTADAARQWAVHRRWWRRCWQESDNGTWSQGRPYMTREEAEASQPEPRPLYGVLWTEVRPDPGPRLAAVSAVGCEQTAEALTQLLGVPVPVDRRTVTMQAGDEALVFRLVDGHYELGLLVRLA